ncbi:MAG: O-antigen ligase family protein [Pyrinomonadaceae bacterium]
MQTKRSTEKDYKSLSPGRQGSAPPDQPSLSPGGADNTRSANSKNSKDPVQTFSISSVGVSETRSESDLSSVETASPSSAERVATEEKAPEKPLSPKAAKKAKQEQKDSDLISNERWLVRNGHLLTYIGVYLFSIMVLFRPYEIVPGLGFLSGTAIYFALVTIAFYIPSQIATEANLTTFPTEVKAVLAMTLAALISVPIAKDPGLAWESFNDPFIKAVIIFVVIINVVRTRERLMGMMWVSFGIAIYLGIAALDLYSKGQFAVEEYRIAVDVGGMFGNPNEMAMHFVMMTPIVIALGVAAASKFWRVIYFAMAGLFVAANMVTFSRGGFIGLIACLGVLAWKLGRRQRLGVTIASIVVGGAAMIAAPGNYGLRMLSIFIPGLDAVGSSDQRQALLIRSLQVTARNPWGIGIGNFPIVGYQNLVSHNAFTQVSSELGLLGLAAYLIFIVSPFRKLGAIERSLFDADDHSWYYYLAIGLQASIVGYLVSSFFASVAYNWFIYYLIGYAVAFRRIYRIEVENREEMTPQIAVQPA